METIKDLYITLLPGVLGARWPSRLVATASEDRLSVPTHTSFAAAAIAEQSAIYEYTAFCNGSGDVKSPRVIVTPPSSRFCPWLAPRPPHYAVRRNGEPI